jgi:hypothetical protein
VSNFIYRLFFTRDDDLDVLQLLFIAGTLFFGVAFALVGAGMWSVPNAAWASFGGVFITLAIAGTPKWVAQLLATSPNPASLAKAIGEAKEYGARTLIDPDLVLK